MAEVRYKTVGTSVMTPTAMTRRKEILVPMVLTDYTLLYHYGDLDRTPVRNATFLATLSNGEKRTGVLDDTGRAQLCGVPKGPVSVTYQHDAPDSDDPAIVEAREGVRKALDAIVAQTRLDMADEWKEWNEAGWLKRQYLETINTAQGGAVGAWHWLSGTVDTIWQLGVLLYKFDKEKREINQLFFTGQWAELDKKLASYRAKGVQVLGEASEVKELLNLIFHDQKTRELIASFAGRWWAAIPPDEQRELVASGGMQIIIDVVIGVLLAAFTAGAAGAAYGSAKWAAAAGRMGARLTKLLDKLKEAFELLAKALRVRKRRTIDLKKRANGARVIETKWQAERTREAAAKLRALAHEKKDGGHSLDRHGPEVSDADLKKRLETGQATDGKFSPTKGSTRFSSYEDWVKTRADALADISRKNNVDLTKPPVPGAPTEYMTSLDHGRAIDEGLVGDVSSRVRVTDPASPTKTGWGYPNSSAVDGITKTTTKVAWNPQANDWQVVQHYPDAVGWDQATKSYIAVP